jgi:hypothetical protein
MTGKFDLPRRPDQSTDGARRAYRDIWAREWPHDDDFLRRLARDVGTLPVGVSKCATLLMAMRENHEFED